LIEFPEVKLGSNFYAPKEFDISSFARRYLKSKALIGLSLFSKFNEFEKESFERIISGDFEEVMVSLFDYYLEVERDTAGYLLAWVMALSGKMKEADELLHDLVSRRSLLGYTGMLRGLVVLDAHKYFQAKELFQMSETMRSEEKIGVQRTEDFAVINFLIGVSYYGLFEYKLAREFLVKALTISVKVTDAFSLLHNLVDDVDKPVLAKAKVLLKGSEEELFFDFAR